MQKNELRHLQINGGKVEGGPPWSLYLPAIHEGYGDAQIDDYGRVAVTGHTPRFSRRHYPWRPGVTLHVRARFSHPISALVGTAGFGFWNAPFGDPTVRWPALPQATWFFYASPPSDLPLAPAGPGQGWFAATLDATTRQALLLAPLAPFVLLLNQVKGLRRRIWPAIQRRLGISYTQIDEDITQWHSYDLRWFPEGCVFAVDGKPLLETSHAPRGPLGFVCWLDNQYMVMRANGRFRWGTLSTPEDQWLEVTDLQIG